MRPILLATMDVFEFDDDDDLKSPPSSPVAAKKKLIVKPTVAVPASFESTKLQEEEEVKDDDSECTVHQSNSHASSTTGDSSLLKTKKGPLAHANGTTPTSTSTLSSTSSTGTTGDDPLTGGRTRHARARARRLEELEKQKQQQKQNNNKVLKGREENNGCSPNKHVRFLADQKLGKRSEFNHYDREDDEDEDEDDNSSSILTTRNSTTSNTSSNGIFNQNNKRRRKLPNPSTTANNRNGNYNNNRASTKRLPEEEDLLSSPDQSTGKKTKSLSAQIQRKLNQHEHQQQHIFGSGSTEEQEVIVVSRKVRGARRDAFAVQDAGNFQMIHDEFLYLTSTILSCPVSIFPTKAGMVESVSELAVMLASTKNRRALWGSSVATNSKSNSKTKRRRGNHREASALEGVLDVLGHATTALSEKFQSSDRRLLALTQQLELVDKENDSATHAPCNCVHHNNQNNIVESYYKGLLLDSMAAIVSFLSWDCTIDNKASAYCEDVGGARAIRKTILQHDGALSAFLYIIRNADPVVSSILEAHLPEINSGNNSVDESQSTNNQGAKAGVNNATSQMSDQSSQQQLSHPASSSVASSNDAGESVETTDPTAAGRRKRRKKRTTTAAAMVGSTLGPITEDMSFTDGLVTNGATSKFANNGSALSPPTSPPRRVVFHNNEPNSDARTKLSFTSEDAMTSSPPRSPLRRRPFGSPSRNAGCDRDDGSSSMVSCDSTLLKIHDHLVKARAQFILPKSEKPSHAAQRHHECQNYRELPLAFGGKDPTGSAAYMAINSLHRLIAGKAEGDSHSCLDETDDSSSGMNKSKNENRHRSGFMSPSEDDVDDGYHSDAIDGEQSVKPSEEDELLLNNPLLQTSRMLGEAGVVRLLAQGMAETLGAAILELEEQVDASGPCQACLQHLHDKFQGLAPIVDNACLLHDDNRTEFCLAAADDSENSTGQGVLIGSLVLFLKRWLQTKTNKKQKSIVVVTLLNEMGLSALRTLTSLTHDNSLAAEQLAAEYLESCTTTVAVCRKIPSTASCWSGAEVIGKVLHRAATVKKEIAGKNAYDTRVFCLNTLANIVGDEPHGDVRRILVGMKLSPARGEREVGTILFLSWLTQWLVGQTDSFLDAIMNGSFGGSNQVDTVTSSKHSERELEKHENEQLVTAGNGCVLLACLLMDAPHVNKNNNTTVLEVSAGPGLNGTHDPLADVTQKIRETILSEMPLDDRSGIPSGTNFIQNTLRAFSNFLYFSVGDLSVAVVAPVRKLISELEKIQVEVIT